MSTACPSRKALMDPVVQAKQHFINMGGDGLRKLEQLESDIREVSTCISPMGNSIREQLQNSTLNNAQRKELEAELAHKMRLQRELEASCKAQIIYAALYKAGVRNSPIAKGENACNGRKGAAAQHPENWVPPLPTFSIMGRTGGRKSRRAMRRRRANTRRWS